MPSQIGDAKTQNGYRKRLASDASDYGKWYEWNYNIQEIWLIKRLGGLVGSSVFIMDIWNAKFNPSALSLFEIQQRYLYIHFLKSDISFLKIKKLVFFSWQNYAQYVLCQQNLQDNTNPGKKAESSQKSPYICKTVF